MQQLIKEAINERVLEILSKRYQGLYFEYGSTLWKFERVDVITCMGKPHYYLVYSVADQMEGREANEIAVMQEIKQMLKAQVGFVREDDFRRFSQQAKEFPAQPWSGDGQAFVDKWKYRPDLATYYIESNAKEDSPFMMEVVYPALKKLARKFGYKGRLSYVKVGHYINVHIPAR
jgi:hypothetical protein